MHAPVHSSLLSQTWKGHFPDPLTITQSPHCPRTKGCHWREEATVPRQYPCALDPRARDRALPSSPASSSHADATANEQRGERAVRIALPSPRTHGCPDRPSGSSCTKSWGFVGLSPLFGSASAALLLLCQAQRFRGGGPCCSQVRTPGFLPSQPKGESRDAQRRRAHGQAREQAAFHGPRRRGLVPAAPAPGACQGRTVLLLRGRMEDAGQGPPVLPNLPVLVLPNKAPALSIGHRPSLLPVSCCAKQRLPGRAAPQQAPSYRHFGMKCSENTGRGSKTLPPACSLLPAAKQLPIALLLAQIHAGLHHDLLPHSSPRRRASA